MFKKIILAIFIFAILVSWLGGIWSISFSPFSFNISKPEKDFLKRVARKAQSIIYREATEHNPPGDIFPDQIDGSMKGQLKKVIN